MLGAQLSLGIDAARPYAIVQRSGSAWRLAAPAFVAELNGGARSNTTLRGRSSSSFRPARSRSARREGAGLVRQHDLDATV